ncbi:MULTISPECIES: type II secretion system protein [Parachlamydia]|jgi:type II secretory pathway pseudopilin PulG|uniref:Putative outer membrane protein TC_0858 n=2 Tax=Parachlamydia acanthamoebae TaxID=83552 RepID=F8L2J5_PARAV|nr:type II secretion system GspH family protein [Parachlamydia acanthamoebae]EFB40293.1 conserved hypothetical protein [Parachlamydia acanthamoebae str. Hall's coccus]CCB87514.1 putative outer membrane protein TC_0858 [Parachlamydia acanthamoebae UV-7]
MNCIVKSKRHVTLIEMMIVMFLIALITGVVAYNYRGALDEGKVFKTKAGIERLETILNLQVSENPALLNDIGNNWQGIVAKSPLVQNPAALIRDGWGEEYKVTVDNGVIHVRSEKLEQYQKSSK